MKNSKKPRPKFNIGDLKLINTIDLDNKNITTTPTQKHNEYDFSEVIPGKLYLTGEAVQNPDNQNKFHYQLNATDDPKLNVEGKVFFQIPLKDSVEENIGKFLPNAFNFIRNALKSDKSIVINCHKGKSRSVTVLLAFIMCNPKFFPELKIKNGNASYDEALNFLRTKRDIIETNLGFCIFLDKLNTFIEYYKEYKEEIDKYSKKNII